MRIGHGFDAHQFGIGDHIIIGGIKIPHSHSVVAYSDGDILIHAICDALLGALGLGDIGNKFPDTSPDNKDIDSSLLLKQVMLDVSNKKFMICNVDSTVITEAPKLSSHMDEIRRNLASLLGIEINQLNIKATTTEKMGYVGRKEGIAAHAVVLLTEVDD
tara:strand:- start:71 stop:550 length:480 start_codon:yes stop_codon:yes gene_type:complete